MLLEKYLSFDITDIQKKKTLEIINENNIVNKMQLAFTILEPILSIDHPQLKSINQIKDIQNIKKAISKLEEVLQFKYLPLVENHFYYILLLLAKSYRTLSQHQKVINTYFIN